MLNFEIMDKKIQFGNKVKMLRLEKGLSQEALALEADLDRTYIPSIEKGKRNISLEVIYKLAKALDIEVADFFR
jgi:transcriptional regulator with XRE-family HTH domain